MPQGNNLVDKLQQWAFVGLIGGIVYVAPPFVVARAAAEMKYLRPVEQSQRVFSPNDVSLSWMESFGGLESVSGRIIEVYNKGNGRYDIALAPDNDGNGRIDRNARIINATATNLRRNPLQVGDEVKLKLIPLSGWENDIQAFYAGSSSRQSR